MKVTVMLEGRILEFRVDDMRTTILEFKQLLFDKYGVPVSEQILYRSHDDRSLLNDASTFANLQVQYDQVVFLLKLKNTRATTEYTLQVHFGSKQSFRVTCHRLTTVSTLKKRLLSLLNDEPALELQFDVAGLVLTDDMNLFQCRGLSTINCRLK